MILHHYTANTGHYSMQPRKDISQAALDYLAPIVTRSGEHVLHGGLRLVIPEGGSKGASSYMILSAKNRNPLVLAALAWQPGTVSEQLWQSARDGIRTLPEQPKGHPWLIVTLLPALDGEPADKIGLIGDLERCVAFAIILHQPGS